MTEEQEIDAALFRDAFGNWLEVHGVWLGEFRGDRFVATVDLNELKAAIMNLNLEENE